MQVIHDALATTDLPRGGIVTIGNYDGIHLGQRTVLDLVVSRARAEGVPAVVITFDPHPLEVVDPDRAPLRLTTMAQKEALLDEVGIDFVLVVRFTPEFSKMPARSFVRDFLHERLGVAEIYVGSDFSFGHRREGDVSLLRQMGESHGFATFAVDDVRGAQRPHLFDPDPRTTATGSGGRGSRDARPALQRRRTDRAR